MVYSKLGFGIELKYDEKPNISEIKPQLLYVYKDAKEQIHCLFQNKDKKCVTLSLNDVFAEECEEVLAVLNDPTQKSQLSNHLVQKIFYATAKAGYTSKYEHFARCLRALQVELEGIHHKQDLQKEFQRIRDEVTVLRGSPTFKSKDYAHLVLPEYAASSPPPIFNATYATKIVQASWSVAELVLPALNDDLYSNPGQYFLPPNVRLLRLVYACCEYMGPFYVPYVIDETSYKAVLAFQHFIRGIVDDPFVNELLSPLRIDLKNKLDVLTAELAIYEHAQPTIIAQKQIRLDSRKEGITGWLEKKAALLDELEHRREDPVTVDEIQSLMLENQVFLQNIEEVIREFETLQEPIFRSDYTVLLENEPLPGTTSHATWVQQLAESNRRLFFCNGVVLNCDILWMEDKPSGLGFDALPLVSMYCYFRYKN